MNWKSFFSYSFAKKLASILHKLLRNVFLLIVQYGVATSEKLHLNLTLNAVENKFKGSAIGLLSSHLA